MLTFLNGAALWGLFAVSLPILIHLFARRKRRRILFSSTALLKQIHHRKMRRLKIKQLLLLILRCLAVVFLVLAFSRPTFKRPGIGEGNAQSSMAVVLDRSLSMRRGHLLDGARDRARDVLKLMQSGDRAALLVSGMDESGSTEFFHDKEVLFRRLRSVEADYSRGGLISEANRALSLLDASRDANRELYLITDLQATEWTCEEDTLASAEWENPVFIIPLSGAAENTAVIACGLESQIFQPGTPLRVFADVENFGDRDVPDLLVRAYWNGNASAQKNVDLRAGQRQRIVFQILPDRGGWNRAFAEIEPDELPEDDERHFVCRIPEKIRVLLAGSSETDIQPLALALDPGAAKESLFQIDRAFPGGAWSENLGGMDVVFFSNYPVLQSGEANRLKQFVREGGGVFIALGENADLRSWSSRIVSPLMNLSLGELAVGSGEQEYLTLDRVDYGHILFRGVFEKEKGDVRSPRVFRRVGVIGERTNVILELKDGSPFLVERSYGKGKVLLLASGIGENWSDFVFSTLFAPLINRSAAYLSFSALTAPPETVGGRPVSMELVQGEPNASYKVEDPSGRSYMIVPELLYEKIELKHPGARIPGIYRFYRESEPIGLRAVNPDPRESDVKPISRTEMEALFPKAPVIWVENPADLAGQVRRARWGREFWRECFALALIFLLLELLITKAGSKNPAGPAESGPLTRR
jgi:hypothetical protein